MEPDKAIPGPREASEAAIFWDGLHRHSRFRPRYPSEHVVRFLRTLPAELSPQAPGVRALDIGCGGGRHTFLLAELGYPVDAVDISVEGLRHVADALAASGLHAKLSTASMTALPFPDESFAIAVSYGVFYYGTAADGRSAVAELHRVLRAGGRAFIVVRTTDDSRCGRGAAVEAQTFCVDYDDTNERGTTQHFLSADAVEEQYGIFRELSFELAETTFRARTGRNSDWLITVEK